MGNMDLLKLMEWNSQEERRHRTTYQNAEESEREKFSLFSAAVRASHEKERTRAERTKNWSIIGSVLGALIGVMGSTYVNRVRLQELKSLLLEAQKGPESLQEALKVQAGNHRSQLDELQAVIDSLKVTLNDAFTQRSAVPAPKVQRAPAPESPSVPVSALKDLSAFSQRTQALLESFQPQLVTLEQGLGRVESSLSSVRGLLDAKPQADARPRELPVERPTREESVDLWESEAAARRLEETQRTLGERMRTSTIYNAVFTYTATAITISAVYLMLRGAG